LEKIHQFFISKNLGKKKKRKTNPCSYKALWTKWDFSMTKREHTFCLIFSIGEEGLFNGKVGPRWFRPRGHMPMVPST
jgi:hypothetical protein